MILIINICKERLHYYEFVKPIEDILLKNGEKFYTKHYTKFNDKDLKADKIIICGTSLRDFDYLNVNYFKWVKKFEKPMLGICGGMQIIGLVFGSENKKKTEIGYYFEEFEKEFLSLKDKHEVYHLHNDYIDLPKNFEKYNSSLTPEAIKHKIFPIYGVLFHPEVRNKKMIEEFVEI